MTNPRPSWIDSKVVAAVLGFLFALGCITAREVVGAKLGTATHEIRIGTIEEQSKTERERHRKHEEKLYETALLLNKVATTMEGLTKTVDRLESRSHGNGT